MKREIGVLITNLKQSKDGEIVVELTFPLGHNPMDFHELAHYRANTSPIELQITNNQIGLAFDKMSTQVSQVCARVLKEHEEEKEAARKFAQQQAEEEKQRQVRPLRA